MPQAPPHPGHSATNASSLARLTQMTHSLDLPGIAGVPPVPGHSVPQPTPPPAAPASSSTSSSKSTAAAAPRQSKSKSRAPSSAAAAPPQAPPTPAGHPALLPHAYPYPPAPHHAPTAAQARSGQPQIAPRPPAQAINSAVMQQYANAMHVQQYQQYAMLHQHNPALVCISKINLIEVSTMIIFSQMSQMYAPQYDPQRNGGQVNKITIQQLLLLTTINTINF